MSAKQRFLAALLALAVPTAAVSLGDEPVKVERGEVEAGPFTTRMRRNYVDEEFWIGAACTPAEGVLRSHLKLEDSAGLVVMSVMPNSPASEAGLERHDVIVAIDGKPVGTLLDLVRVVQEAGKKPSKFEVIRAGKMQTIEVTPAQRPDKLRMMIPMPEVEAQRRLEHGRMLQEQLEQLRDRLPDAEIKRMEEWVEQLRRGEQQPLRMQMFGPGVVMRKFEAPALPPGVTVRVERQGGEPAKVHVERGDEQWDVTEKELDKLPEDLRGPVGAMLGGPRDSVMLHGPHGAAAAAIAGGGEGHGKMKVEIRTNEAAAGGGDPQQALQDAQRRMQDDMQRLNKELESLRKKVDEMKQLQKNTPAKKPVREEA